MPEEGKNLDLEGATVTGNNYILASSFLVRCLPQSTTMHYTYCLSTTYLGFCLDHICLSLKARYRALLFRLDRTEYTMP